MCSDRTMGWRWGAGSILGRRRKVCGLEDMFAVVFFFFPWRKEEKKAKGEELSSERVGVVGR